MCAYETILYQKKSRIQAHHSMVDHAFHRVPMGQEKVREKIFKNQENFVKSQEKLNQSAKSA